MSDTDLSSRIRQRREQLGLSQEELAARMGYRSKSSITKLEKGINDLPRAKLEELAAALDTNRYSISCGWKVMGDARKDIEIGNEKLPYFYNSLSVRFFIKNRCHSIS